MVRSICGPLALAAVMAAGGKGQEPAAPVPPAPMPSAPVAGKPFDDPAARALLRAAAHAQFTGTPATDVATAPLALRVKVALQLRTAKGDSISIAAERRFLAPDHIWTRAIETYNKTETISGYDGEGSRPWLHSAAAGLRWLDEPGTDADLKQLRDDLELTSLLTEAFQIARLEPRIEGLTRLPDQSAYDLTTSVIEGDVAVARSGATKRARLRLWIEQKQHRLMGARLMAPDEPPLQICFTKHERVDGLDMPREVKIYVNDEAKPSKSLWIELLQLAPAFADGDFSPPR
ncbi:MAG: hypothetical protein EXS13_12460 [Planctomycetes bacterium]|nr:hypothetical protein [Planctomycetota bacterium]